MSTERIEEALARADLVTRGATGQSAFDAERLVVLAAALREAQERLEEALLQRDQARDLAERLADKPDDGHGGALWRDKRHHQEAYGAGPPADEAKR